MGKRGIEELFKNTELLKKTGGRTRNGGRNVVGCRAPGF